MYDTSLSLLSSLESYVISRIVDSFKSPNDICWLKLERRTLGICLFYDPNWSVQFGSNPKEHCIKQVLVHMIKNSVWRKCYSGYLVLYPLTK